MALCSTECVKAVPTITLVDCEIPTRIGAIGYLGIFSCNSRFNSTVVPPAGGSSVIGAITDAASWTQLATDNMFALSPNLGASKPASSQTKEDFPCVGEIVTAELHTLQIDSIVAPTDLSDFTFWTELYDNPRSYVGAYFDCCGLMYGTDCDADAPFFNLTSDVQPIYAKSSKDPVRWQGTISWAHKGIMNPTDLGTAVTDYLGFTCITC